MERFFKDIDKDAKILEVGCNYGTKLKSLQQIGYKNLYGIDIQPKAIEQAHKNRPELNVIKGNALDIPFKDGFFDVVYTNGVLIHIPPDEINDAMDEITRCTSKWVYGHEYYSDTVTEVKYRGRDRLLWKADFPSMYQEGRDLEVADIEYLDHIDNENTDVEFLLRKTSDES